MSNPRICLEVSPSVIEETCRDPKIDSCLVGPGNQSLREAEATILRIRTLESILGDVTLQVRASLPSVWPPPAMTPSDKDLELNDTLGWHYYAKVTTVKDYRAQGLLKITNTSPTNPVELGYLQVEFRGTTKVIYIEETLLPEESQTVPYEIAHVGDTSGSTSFDLNFTLHEKNGAITQEVLTTETFTPCEGEYCLRHIETDGRNHQSTIVDRRGTPKLLPPPGYFFTRKTNLGDIVATWEICSGTGPPYLPMITTTLAVSWAPLEASSYSLSVIGGILSFQIVFPPLEYHKDFQIYHGATGSSAPQIENFTVEPSTSSQTRTFQLPLATRYLVLFPRETTYYFGG